jgi:hypothetical protein
VWMYKRYRCLFVKRHPSVAEYCCLAKARLVCSPCEVGVGCEHRVPSLPTQWSRTRARVVHRSRPCICRTSGQDQAVGDSRLGKAFTPARLMTTINDLRLWVACRVAKHFASCGILATTPQKKFLAVQTNRVSTNLISTSTVENIPPTVLTVGTLLRIQDSTD